MHVCYSRVVANNNPDGGQEMTQAVRSRVGPRGPLKPSLLADAGERAGDSLPYFPLCDWCRFKIKRPCDPSDITMGGSMGGYFILLQESENIIKIVFIKNDCASFSFLMDIGNTQLQVNRLTE